VADGSLVTDFRLQVVMEILYFAVWCRPFSQYWAVPAYSSKCRDVRERAPLISPAQCSAATHHLITNTVFNVSSDLIIISIPIPVLFRVRLQTRKNKIILCGLFMIGAFTVNLPEGIVDNLLNHTRLSQLFSTSIIPSQIPSVQSGPSGTCENRILPYCAPIFH
jgi:hypothetical protein